MPYCRATTGRVPQPLGTAGRAGANAVDADEQVGQRVDQRRPLHGQPPLMPGQAQLAQGADLRIRREAGPQVRLRVRLRRGHPGDGDVDDLVPERAEGAAVGLGQQHPGETFVVHQCTDERPQPRLRRRAGSRRPERIDPLRHHRDGMVHDRTLELRQRREALVEVPLGQAHGQADAADAERPAPSVPAISKAACTNRCRRSTRRMSALTPLKGIVTWYSIAEPG